MLLTSLSGLVALVADRGGGNTHHQDEQTSDQKKEGRKEGTRTDSNLASVKKKTTYTYICVQLLVRRTYYVRICMLTYAEVSQRSFLF